MYLETESGQGARRRLPPILINIEWGRLATRPIEIGTTLQEVCAPKAHLAQRPHAWRVSASRPQAKTC